MAKYRLYQVDSFTTEKFLGNPAGVISNADGLSDEQMQSIARELNNSETAFMLSPSADDHDLWIRYFTPTTEVPICGHATIASHYVRAMELGIESATVLQKSGVGVLPVETISDSSGLMIVMSQGQAKFLNTLSESQQKNICKALGIEQNCLEDRCPMEIVSTGHSKVMIGVKNQELLHQLQPDLSQLKELSDQLDCNGFYVFTLDSKDRDIFAHGRMFAPAIGIAEDPVTGNANGPLGAYVAKHKLLTPDSNGMISFTARQGEAMGRLGHVLVSVHTEAGIPTSVKVAGRAVVAFSTELEV